MDRTVPRYGTVSYRDLVRYDIVLHFRPEKSMQAKATQETVFSTADALLAAGCTPTAELLMNKVGGSKSTILRHLSAWWQRQSNTPQAEEDATVAGVEQRMHDMITDLRRARVTAEERAITAEADAHEARTSEAAHQEAETQARQERDAAVAIAAAATATIQELTARHQAAQANEAAALARAAKALFDRDTAIGELRQITAPTMELPRLRPVALRAVRRSAVGIGARGRMKRPRSR